MGSNTERDITENNIHPPVRERNDDWGQEEDEPEPYCLDDVGGSGCGGKMGEERWGKGYVDLPWSACGGIEHVVTYDISQSQIV